MPRRRFDQSKPFVTLGILLLLWLIAPTIGKRFTRIGFYELYAPLDVVTSYARDLQTYWSLRTRSKNDIIEAYGDLRDVTITYARAADENAALRAEIQRLETLLRLPSFDAYRSEPARVARRDFNTWWQRLVIRKGENHGIQVGSPVIFIGGVVGRVTEVHATTSIVDLISSPNVRLAASFEDDDRPISFQGGINPPLGTPQATLEFAPLDLYASADAPRNLVTSGLGGVFPRGLHLGRVVLLEPSPDGLFKTGRVALDPRLNQLTAVTVLVPLSSP